LPIRIDAGTSRDEANGGDGRGRNVMTTMTLVGAVTLPGLDQSVAHARRFVGGLVGHDHRRFDDASVITSELVTNSVQHSRSGRGGHVVVIVEADEDVIQISVIDDGGQGNKPHVRHDPYAEDGRGLVIVGNLADKWGVEAEGQYTAIWVHLEIPDSTV
jgi:anti-sigma regulatory factor (Ser/Thr protein kinase)